MLAEADGLRAGGPPGRRRALALYRGLRDSLDAGRPEDAARVLWVFENDARRDGPVGEMAAAAAKSGAEPEFRELAALVRGQATADLGRLDEAEEVFRGLLGRGRGTGSRIERLACLSLAKLFAHQRRGFEALALARRAAALARKAENSWDLCVARARICLALQVIDDGERLAQAVDELDRALDDAPEDRARPLRWLVLGFRVEAALETDDLDGARRALEGLRALSGPSAGPTGDARLPLYLDAEIEARSGRPAEALTRIAGARAIPARVPASDLPLSLLEARCLAESGDDAGARRAMAAFLDLLDEELDPDPFGTGQRIRWATAAGRLLQDRIADAEGARRAFDMAAGWVVRRIVEIDRAIAEMPELSDMATEDLRALTDHRNRFVREQAEILDRVAGLFSGETPPPGLVHGGGGEEGYFHACAWCRRVKTADDRWLPIGEFLPDDKRLRISHGICQDCRRRWTERMTAT
jgi:tetratricopeptide (TPR) repeat protein